MLTVLTSPGGISNNGCAALWMRHDVARALLCHCAHHHRHRHRHRRRRHHRLFVVCRRPRRCSMPLLAQGAESSVLLTMTAEMPSAEVSNSNTSSAIATLPIWTATPSTKTLPSLLLYTGLPTTWLADSVATENRGWRSSCNASACTIPSDVSNTRDRPVPRRSLATILRDDTVTLRLPTTAAKIANANMQRQLWSGLHGVRINPNPYIDTNTPSLVCVCWLLDLFTLLCFCAGNKPKVCVYFIVCSSCTCISYGFILHFSARIFVSVPCTVSAHCKHLDHCLQRICCVHPTS